MTIFVDRPVWPGFGRFWSHMVSDHSIDELLYAAEAAGLPERLFDVDHVDVPDDRWELVVTQGAIVVPSRELVQRLIDSGLRRPRPGR